MSIAFLLDGKPDVIAGGAAGERSGGARKVLYRAARSHSGRAVPSACVGKRFCFVQIIGIDRLDARGYAGGRGSVRPRWLRILTITGGSSMAAMIFKAPPQLVSRTTLDYVGAWRDPRHDERHPSCLPYAEESFGHGTCSLLIER